MGNLIPVTSIIVFSFLTFAQYIKRSPCVFDIYTHHTACAVLNMVLTKTTGFERQILLDYCKYQNDLLNAKLCLFSKVYGIIFCITSKIKKFLWKDR